MEEGEGEATMGVGEVKGFLMTLTAQVMEGEEEEVAPTSIALLLSPYLKVDPKVVLIVTVNTHPTIMQAVVEEDQTASSIIAVKTASWSLHWFTVHLLHQ